MVTRCSRFKLLLLTFLIEGIAMIAALIMAGFYDIEMFPLTGNILRDVITGTSGALFPLVLFIYLLSEKAHNIPLIRSLRSTIIHDIKTIFSETKLVDLFFISLCAGVSEELLFRGVIQVKLGIVGASIIFGLLHCITPAYCVMATIMGFYMGGLFLYYDSLLVPVQVHFVYDLGALIYIRYFIKPHTD